MHLEEFKEVYSSQENLIITNEYVYRYYGNTCHVAEYYWFFHKVICFHYMINIITCLIFVHFIFIFVCKKKVSFNLCVLKTLCVFFSRPFLEQNTSIVCILRTSLTYLLCGFALPHLRIKIYLQHLKKN